MATPALVGVGAAGHGRTGRRGPVAAAVEPDCCHDAGSAPSGRRRSHAPARHRAQRRDGGCHGHSRPHDRLVGRTAQAGTFCVISCIDSHPGQRHRIAPGIEDRHGGSRFRHPELHHLDRGTLPARHLCRPQPPSGRDGRGDSEPRRHDRSLHRRRHRCRFSCHLTRGPAGATRDGGSTRDDAGTRPVATGTPEAGSVRLRDRRGHRPRPGGRGGGWRSAPSARLHDAGRTDSPGRQNGSGIQACPAYPHLLQCCRLARDSRPDSLRPRDRARQRHRGLGGRRSRRRAPATGSSAGLVDHFTNPSQPDRAGRLCRRISPRIFTTAVDGASRPGIGPRDRRAIPFADGTHDRPGPRGGRDHSLATPATLAGPLGRPCLAARAVGEKYCCCITGTARRRSSAGARGRAARAVAGAGRGRRAGVLPASATARRPPPRSRL